MYMFQADVIVNSVGQDFVLSKGLVSKSLLNKAGDGLRLEVSSRYPEALQLWSMASTSGHSLLCQKVFHLVLDGFPDDGAKNKANKCITVSMSRTIYGHNLHTYRAVIIRRSSSVSNVFAF